MSNEIFDDLGDLSNASTTYPILPAQVYSMTVVKAEIVDKKDDASKKNLLVTLGTSDPQKDINGNDTNAGLQVRQYIGLSETEKRTKANIQGDLAKLMLCFTGSQTGKFDPEKLIGLSGSVKLKIEHSDEYGDKNAVATYVPKK